MNFLVVDDMNNMRRSIRAMLQIINYGKKIYEAPNGRVAWEILGEFGESIDFIICDFTMPVMSGTELLHRLRLNKKLRDIPFLMITAEANMEVVAEAAEHDVDGYLTKPFITASLEHKIKELLHKVFHPDPYIIHLRASRTFEEKGNLKKAIDEAQKALKNNPRSSRPYRELGRLFFKDGKKKEGIDFFNKAIRINRLDVSSFHFLGQIYYRQKQLDKAIHYFSRAMQISPRDSKRAIKFARLLLQEDKKTEAAKVLRLLLKQNRYDSVILEQVATLAFNHSLHNLAIKCLESMLKNDPDSPVLHKRLGIMLEQKGFYHKAVPHFEQAMEKGDEDDIDLFLGLARVYLHLNRIILAEKWAGQARRLAPDNAEVKRIMDACL